MSLTEAAIRAELAQIIDPDTGLDLIEGNNVQAVGVDGHNAAIALQRPLLIKGEPGTGKSVVLRLLADRRHDRQQEA